MGLFSRVNNAGLIEAGAHRERDGPDRHGLWTLRTTLRLGYLTAGFDSSSRTVRLAWRASVRTRRERVPFGVQSNPPVRSRWP